MKDFKGFEYDLAIQALELQGNTLDELFKALIEVAKEFDKLPCATEFIKDWDILFSNLAFIADYLENHGYSLKGIISEYDVTFFANLENALAEIFVENILSEIAKDYAE